MRAVLRGRERPTLLVAENSCLAWERDLGKVPVATKCSFKTNPLHGNRKEHSSFEEPSRSIDDSGSLRGWGLGGDCAGSSVFSPGENGEPLEV